jgi:hypothetical protein
MRTLIVSDLHLGSVTDADLLRRAEVRAPLLEAAREVDRVVLLGDVLELRQSPPRDAMAAARPLFEDLGRSLAGGELVIMAGNHDHALIEPWLARRGFEERPRALELEQLLAPGRVSAMLERIAQWASPARVISAYPGMWVRPDVYATHGHYLDCHLTVPTLERLSLGVMARVLGRPAEQFAAAEDYEAVASPVFAWRDAVARVAPTGKLLSGITTLAVWRALGGFDEGAGRTGAARPGAGRAGRDHRPGRTRALRTRALAGAFPLAVAALNRAGLGPLGADISGAELRRAGLRAMAEVAARLGMGEGYLVFGHTHRAGPLPGDREREWRGSAEDATRPGGPSHEHAPKSAGRPELRLVNCGNWVYAPDFLTARAGESPYWPGACVLVEDAGAPVLKRLLQERTHSELAPAPRRRPERGRGARPAISRPA